MNPISSCLVIFSMILIVTLPGVLSKPSPNLFETGSPGSPFGSGSPGLNNPLAGFFGSLSSGSIPSGGLGIPDLSQLFAPLSAGSPTGPILDLSQLPSFVSGGSYSSEDNENVGASIIDIVLDTNSD